MRRPRGKRRRHHRQRVSANVSLFFELGPHSLTAAVVVGVGRVRAADRLSAFGPTPRDVTSSFCFGWRTLDECIASASFSQAGTAIQSARCRRTSVDV
mmetsp:Transcript_74951/g.243555  ORF Transcript_74951/g.243555 Transcript_74951/m.243555 type:complete len:98 (-) Transcript_74951:139-432(-)